LNQTLFFFADRLVMREEAGDVGFIGSGVVRREQDGAAGEAGFNGV
jgi:hypothetical protein